MAITGKISLARPGEAVQTFQRVDEIENIFDINSSPSLQANDHVTLYPGDFTDINNITVPENVYVTILPGALVQYNEIEKVENRYVHIDGAVKNVGDLNLASRYETSSSFQFSSVRVYPAGSDDRLSGVSAPYISFDNLDDAIEEIKNGDTIVVFPGEYSPTKNLMVNGTTWNFLPGAEVTFDPDFENIIREVDDENIGTDIDGDGQNEIESVCPHALFDDSKSIIGVTQEGTAKSVDILGEGTFIIGSSGIQNLLERTTDGDGFSDTYAADTISAVTDWEGWHRYGLLGITHQSSEVKFEAKKVRMEENIDAAIKYSNCETLDIDVDTVEVANSHDAGSNVKNIGSEISGFFPDPRPKVPAFMIINGTNKTRSGKEHTDLKISNFEFGDGWNGEMYGVVGMNHTPEIPAFSSDHRKPYEGTISIEFEGHPNITQAVSFSGRIENSGYGRTSPRKVVIKDSNFYSPVFYRGNTQHSDLGWREDEISDLIIKNTEISTEEDVPPITISGDVSNTNFSLSSVWLINEQGGVGQVSIEDSTDSTNFELKVYGSSFANLPVQNYDEVLHDQLNNIIWTEDVTSIR